MPKSRRKTKTKAVASPPTVSTVANPISAVHSVGTVLSNTTTMDISPIATSCSTLPPAASMPPQNLTSLSIESSTAAHAVCSDAIETPIDEPLPFPPDNDKEPEDDNDDSDESDDDSDNEKEDEGSNDDDD